MFRSLISSAPLRRGAEPGTNIGLRLGGFLRPAPNGSILLVIETNPVKSPRHGTHCAPWTGDTGKVLGRLFFGFGELRRLFVRRDRGELAVAVVRHRAPPGRYGCNRRRAGARDVVGF